jgi:hypothetical protein
MDGARAAEALGSRSECPQDQAARQINEQRAIQVQGPVHPAQGRLQPISDYVTKNSPYEASNRYGQHVHVYHLQYV